MSPKTRKVLALAVVALAVGATAAPALAQNAVMHEVTESMVLKNLRTPHRMATASLFGSISPGSSICPAALAAFLGIAKCSINVTASDDIDLATGTGRVTGSFQVLVPGDNATDGDEAVIFRGSLRGRMDLSPAILGLDGVPFTGDEIPLGTIVGRWAGRGERGGPLQGVYADGTLSGTFRLPFEVAPGVAAYVLDPTTFPAPGSFAFVLPDERSLGKPTVKLEISFVE
jgi:hypothetical protein